MSWDPAARIGVVTGASSGIGRATAVRLAEAGMTVVAVARRSDRLDELAADHATIMPHAADVTDTEAMDALVERVRTEFGSCHALINNAGIGGGPFEGRDDLDDTLRTIDVNLGGVVRATAAFADLLAASAPSRVVNVASVAGKVGVGPAGYAASKFGVVGFSEALAFSWASRGVVVSHVNPGFIETEGFTQEQIKRTPLGRLVGAPEDVAEAVLETLVRGAWERTVPRWYRPFVVLRHTATPAYRAVAARMARAGGTRE